MTTSARSLAEWGAAPPATRSAVGAYAVPAVALVVVSLLFGALTPSLGVLAFLLGGGLLVWFGLSRGSAALKTAKARPAESGELPRVRNLIAGLASDLSVPAPELWVIDEAGDGRTAASPDAAPRNAAPLNAAPLNVMVAWRSGPVVAVAARLEERLTRTECEAVLAHCMVRFRSGEAKASTLRAGMGPFAPTGREAAHADLPAVALTRYPPALASALTKMTPQGGAFAALWFVPAAGAEASPERRAAALRGL